MRIGAKGKLSIASCKREALKAGRYVYRDLGHLRPMVNPAAVDLNTNEYVLERVSALSLQRTCASLIKHNPRRRRSLGKSTIYRVDRDPTDSKDSDRVL